MAQRPVSVFWLAHKRATGKAKRQRHRRSFLSDTKRLEEAVRVRRAAPPFFPASSCWTTPDRLEEWTDVSLRQMGATELSCQAQAAGDSSISVRFVLPPRTARSQSFRGVGFVSFSWACPEAEQCSYFADQGREGPSKYGCVCKCK